MLKFIPFNYSSVNVDKCTKSCHDNYNQNTEHFHQTRKFPSVPLYSAPLLP